ncbi:MAG: peptide chain release factor N(5)-glutamine methyltransferase [Clostridia bacterium]|nr:peptide chain release factor N(5)-glutamine methyltransferase [Clostridia bacterium]
MRQDNFGAMRLRMARKNVCPIGGQAVLEGVMMRGRTSYATAVRTPEGKIVIESERISPPKKWSKIPIIRGVLNFLSMMYLGMKILMRSAEVFGEQLEEEAPGKFEKWLAKTLHIDIMTIAIWIALPLGLALSIGLFFVLPQLIVSGLELLGVKLHPIVFNLIEGVVRIAIFMLYLLLVRLMKEIKRVFMYHGAEHKTISCYEKGLELTPENAKTMSTKHDRCGTNFIVIVMLVSVIIFSLTGWTANPNLPKAVNVLIRVGIRLTLLPLVAGLAYELLKFLAKYDNWFVKIFKAPGLLVQKLTTVEPTDDMLEVAIAAFKAVELLDSNADAPTSTFEIKKDYTRLRTEVESYLAGVEETVAKTDWILSEITGVQRSELAQQKFVNEQQYKKAIEYSKKVAGGTPLQYVLGNTSFYGNTIKVDSRVLIPRQETELLVSEALKYIKEDSKVLDICTGSGAIAIAIAKGKGIKVTASDISAEALEVAAENATANGVDIIFIRSDMFASIEEKFDIIICNPPYISRSEMEVLPEDVKKEPRLALFGGNSGLDYYRILADNIKKHLNGGGVLLMEIGSKQSVDVKQLFAEYKTETYKDYSGLDRIVKVVNRE